MKIQKLTNKNQIAFTANKHIKNRMIQLLEEVFSGTQNPDQIIASTNAHRQNLLCSVGALWNLIVLNKQGKDVIFKLGSKDGSNEIAHVWVESGKDIYQTNDYRTQDKPNRMFNPNKIYDNVWYLAFPKEMSLKEIAIIFLKLFSDYDLHEALLEDSRARMLNKSRDAGEYKDKSKGKNRFERQKYSKIAASSKQYNQINMDNFFKKDILTVVLPIIGETSDYTVNIQIDGILAEIQKNLKRNHYRYEYKVILQAITKLYNTKDIRVKCNCPDFLYNFAHWTIVNNQSIDDSSKDPGLGKGIANPNNDKGVGCKHIMLALNNVNWVMKVATVIDSYCRYMAKNKQDLFCNFMMPKLYGVLKDDAEVAGLVEKQEDIESSKDIIQTINDHKMP